MKKAEVIELVTRKMLIDQADYFGLYHDTAKKQWDDNSRCLKHNIYYGRLYAKRPYVEVDGVRYNLTPSDVKQILSTFEKQTLIG